MLRSSVDTLQPFHTYLKKIGRREGRKGEERERKGGKERWLEMQTVFPVSVSAKTGSFL